MITRQKGTAVGVVQADVVRGVARCMQHEPFATCQREYIAVLDMLGDLRQETTSSEGRVAEPSQAFPDRGAVPGPLPRGWRRDPLQRGEDIADRVSGSAAISFELLHMRREIVNRSFAVVIVGAMSMVLSAVLFIVLIVPC